MKTISELMSEKSAILGAQELSGKGSAMWGSNTMYYGPSNPSSVATYIDGNYCGKDAHSGKLCGDWWDLYLSSIVAKPGMLYIKSY